jgi:hypothetical protein
VLLGVGLEGARVDAQVVHHRAAARADHVLLELRHRDRGQYPDDQDDDRQLKQRESGLAAGFVILEG